MKDFSLVCYLAIFGSGLLGIHSAAAQDMPAFRMGDRVLFQGDSITDMNRGRNADPNHILGHSYVFIIAGDAAVKHPERQLKFINRGVSGNKVSDLARRWKEDTLDLKPTVLSILIGVNDLNGGVSAEQYEKQYDDLLAETVKALPTTRLILGEPFGLPTGNKANDWDAYRAELAKRQDIVARLGEKYHAPVIKFQKVFDDAVQRAPAAYWIWDGVHPTYAGQRLLADEWLRVANEAWKK